jgi:hypothetical protein
MLSIIKQTNEKAAKPVGVTKCDYLPKTRTEALEMIKKAAKPDIRVQLSIKEMRKSPFFQRLKINRRKSTENDAVTLFKTGQIDI